MSNKSSSDSRRLANDLHSYAIHLLRKLRHEDESSGLSASRLSALSVVVFGGPISLGSLAAAEQVRPPTMTRIVIALELQRLVVKKQDPSDARGVRISATPTGRKLLLEARNRRVHLLAQQLGTLSVEKRAVLHEAVAILFGL